MHGAPPSHYRIDALKVLRVRVGAESPEPAPSGEWRRFRVRLLTGRVNYFDFSIVVRHADAQPTTVWFDDMMIERISAG